MLSVGLREKLGASIRARAIELNGLLETAHKDGLQIKIDAPVGFPERLFGQAPPSIKIEIHEVHFTKY